MPQGKQVSHKQKGIERLRDRFVSVQVLPICLSAVISGCSIGVTSLPEPSPESRSSPEAMTYVTYDLPNATVHVVKIDPDVVTFSMAVADGLETVEAIARQENAIAAINAGFFDPQNGKTTSYLFSEGQLIGDPADNERLMENPNLQSYLPGILNRSEFRHYRCSQPDGEFDDDYAIARRLDSAPSGCQLHNAIGGGPQLAPTDTSAAEAFTDTQNGELIRDAIGSIGPNARSAIGLIENTQEIVLIMAAQRADAPGFTLSEMTDFSATLGVTALLNLDGGSSSGLYYREQIYLAKQDAEGTPIERPVKSVIVFK